MTIDIGRWLDELGVTWTFHDALDTERIDEATSLRNQARFEPLDDETVARYAEAMADGATFPPVVVHDAKTEKAKRPWVILSGNHRVAAALRSGTKIAGYVVDRVEDPTVLLRIQYEDNARHGLALSRPERLRHGLHLIDNGFSVRDAARCVGCRDTDLSTAKRVRDAAERARDLGLATFETLPEAVQVKLCRIDHDGPFRAAVSLAARARLTAAHADEVAKAVKAAGSDAAALEAVAELEAMHRERIQSNAGMKRRTVSPRAQLLNYCALVNRLSQPDIVRSVIDDADAAALRRSVRKAVDHLESIAAAIGDR